MNRTDEVRELLESKFGLEQNIPSDAALFSGGRLNSLNSIQLLLELESTFGITISPLDVSLEDVDSIDKIDATVTRLCKPS